MHETEVRPPRGRLRARVDLWLPAALFAIFAAAYSLLSLTRFARLSTPSWDNAIFQQAVRAYANLHAPIVDIKGPGYNILGDHFSPVLAVLAPFYRVFPFAGTLLVAQAVLIAASIVPITRIALRQLGTPAGTAVGLAYSLSFGIQSAVYTDFHEVAFAAPLIAFAGEAFLTRRWKSVAAWTIPLLLVKEDLGITVAAIGVVMAIVGARKIGLALAGTGIAGFLLVVLVVIPAFNSHGTFDYWGAVSFGHGGPSALHTFFTGWDFKTPTLLLTFGVTGFLALRSPWALVAGPTLAWRWIGRDTDYWGTNFHYSLILMSIVFIAMVDAVNRVGVRDPRWLRRYTEHVPTLTLAVALVLCLQFPLFGLFKAETYRPSPDAAAAAAVIALMPKGSSVETNLGLITHLVTDYHVYATITVGSVVPDFVLIDTHGGDETHGDVAGFAQQQHPGSSYREIFDSGGYELAERG